MNDGVGDALDNVCDIALDAHLARKHRVLHLPVFPSCICRHALPNGTLETMAQALLAASSDRSVETDMYVPKKFQSP